MTRMHKTLIALTLLGATAIVHAEPWTYHGTLSDGGRPANGRYNLRLSLLDEAAAKSFAAPITLYGVEVRDGMFATEVDFGIALANAPALKLKTEVAVGGSGFVALGAPVHFDAKSTLAGLCWDTQGNTATNPATDFIGTIDAQPLNIRAGNMRTARFVAAGTVANYGDAPQVVLGSSANTAAGFGATVGGGGATRLGGGLDANARNSAAGDFSLVGGGAYNTADGDHSVVDGGYQGSAGGQASVVGGGFMNLAGGQYSAVAGGNSNDSTGTSSTVGGGNSNIADGSFSTVAGGSLNCAGGDYSWAGGRRAKVRPGNQPTDSTCVAHSGDGDGDEGSFVWADSQETSFISSGPNQFAIRANGGLRWAGTGQNSTTSPAFTHVTNIASNTCSGGSGVANSRTAINHPLLNNNPNAVIVMTPNYGPTATGVAPPRNPLAVYYNSSADGNCAAGRWVIYDVTLSPAALNNGAMFNIWFVLP
jgi:trimeric autotransporter adhesin